MELGRYGIRWTRTAILQFLDDCDMEKRVCLPTGINRTEEKEGVYLLFFILTSETWTWPVVKGSAKWPILHNEIVVTASLARKRECHLTADDERSIYSICA